ncbi:hypothetical protein HD597_000841 [Nonomuraea thailandensis]|uniref:Uncharacterized protein n=1 Tax=Nonomuraea thailandensis TaxID=1188745 RepID=A0A9X2GEC8_9ACTN|nr:hypothetical protein [Nonomuraea thailandensis]MCP2353821.1 hypothetical protein [Nonomuraea thailandensis]
MVMLTRGVPDPCHTFEITAVLTPEAVIRGAGEIATDARVALVDSRTMHDRPAIVATLLLWNSGLAVVVGDPSRVPDDLVTPIDAYMAAAEAEGKRVQTELLIMEDAMHLYDDISEIARAFETYRAS